MAGENKNSERYRIGDLIVDITAQRVARNGQQIPLPNLSFDFLKLLIRNAPNVVTHDQLMDEVWPGLVVSPETVSKRANLLRSSLDDDSHDPRYIQLVRGRGYRLAQDVERLPSVPTPRKLGYRAAFIGAIAVALAVTIFSIVREPPRDKSIAVLPFANLSGDAQAQAFTDGVHYDLLTRLAEIADLKSISRTSLLQYRDTTKTLRQIAEELGAATIMEGSVQRAGNTIRINVQLVDAVTDEHLWARTYDRELTAANIFAIQSEIASAIAKALRATLTPAEEDRIKNVPTENMAALEAYFRGRQRLATRTTAGLVDAVGHFQRAIELDPSFALAYVGLASTYAIQGVFTGLPPDAQAAKAEAALEQAFALDDGLGEAYTLLGAIKHHYRGDYAGAEIAFERALELSPNHAMAHHWYGLLLEVDFDRLDEALIQYRRALELEPLAPNIRGSLSFALLMTGQHEAALAEAERIVELSPTAAVGHFAVGVVCSGVLAELDKGVISLRKAVEREPEAPGFSAILGLSYLDLGDVHRADRWLQRSIGIGAAKIVPNTAMAMLHTYRNEGGQALEYANRAVRTTPVWSYDPLYRQRALGLVRNARLKADRAAEARSLYQTQYPALLNDDEPTINGTNLIAAIDLALVLTRTGEQDRSEELLDRSLAVIQDTHRAHLSIGSVIPDVQILALQGKSDEALAALRQAIGQGWRQFWWYHAEHDPNLESIRDEPEFRAMMEDIRADMVEQRARLHEWEANDETAPIPESAE